MTQSGQGEEPSARQAHEGIVLPSDGGEPVLPGPAGGPAGPQSARPAPASAPPGAQAWDQPWGPGQQQYTQSQGEGWPTPPGAEPWGSGGPGLPPAAPHDPPPHPGPGPLPPENAQPPAYGAQPSYGHQGYGQTYGQPPAYGHQAQDVHPQAYGQPGAPGQQPHYGQPGPYDQQGPHGAHPQPGAHAQHPQHGAHPQHPAPMPVADEGATQYLPPVPAPADEGATQYIPPVTPGALPPERPAAGAPSDATQFLGQAPPPHPDAEATQYIAPVPAGPAVPPHGGAPGADDGRQPPAEFDSLFRGAPGPDGPASSTQQLPAPAFDEPGPAYAAPQGAGGGRRGGRSGSRLPLLAAVGVGLAVVGVGAGAMMAGGDGGDDDKGGNQPVSATAPVESASASPSPSVDPARQQAVELDKLLARSGDSRSTVISAVADVKSCDNLPQAAKDLREAAKQRTGLVTSLSQLSVDKLPRHTELTTALTKAWQASASADNHYAAWADQTAGKKGCKKGQARSTSETQAGNRASGTASKEKATAAALWNAIARQYGLTERQATQL
ncbi:hypothetical protein AB0O68_14155 [Streptomyces sp. NPDC087512]|uniref:hypothetical protein n=1 Tax=Streptomyces sp. NPDC087512 TaxID=3155059 RepID=UPI0034329E7B